MKYAVDVKLLQSLISERGVLQSKAAKFSGLSVSGFWRKLQGKRGFLVEELDGIRKGLRLTWREYLDVLGVKYDA